MCTTHNGEAKEGHTTKGRSFFPASSLHEANKKTSIRGRQQDTSMDCETGRSRSKAESNKHSTKRSKRQEESEIQAQGKATRTRRRRTKKANEQAKEGSARNQDERRAERSETAHEKRSCSVI